jgi:uncharacterized lipoprotein YajG
MRLAILLAVLFLTGCATTRTTIIVSGELDGVDIAARYELGGRR